MLEGYIFNQMSNLNLITMFAFVLLFFCNESFSNDISGNSEIVTENQPDSNKTKSVNITKHSDSIKCDSTLSKDQKLHLQADRRKAFIFDSLPDYYEPFFVSSPEMYRKDAIALAEELRFHPLIATARLGLSSSLNRYLPYGLVAPATKVWTNGIIPENLPFNSYSLNFSDQFSTETEAISIQNSGIFLLDYPIKAPLPEAVILWENGVFDENILGVRISRPLSHNIMLSVFSNYRFFKGMEFSHDGNDVYTFYSGMYKDSSNNSRYGYNPEVNEHTSGAQIAYLGNQGNSLRLKLRYSDLANEIALDKFSIDSNQLYQKLHRYPLRLDISSNANRFKGLFWDIGATYLNVPVVKIEPDFSTGRTIPLRSDGSINNLLLSLQSGKELRKSDSAGISFLTSWGKTEQFDRSSNENLLFSPRLFYKLYNTGSHSQFHVDVKGGVEIGTSKDSVVIFPSWHTGIVLTRGGHELRAYFEQDNISNSVPLDTSTYSAPQLLDNYFKGGIEYYLHSDKAQILFGYQFLSGINNSSISSVWPAGIPPYTQPRSVFILSPAVGRWKGFALSGTGFFSDQKPYIKAQSRLSYVFHPMSTSEYIDINLGFEYWSERDPITFAGRNDWNKAFYNLDLEIAAHILSFRLFYKVDNILNRQFAYAPGYYSPGLTFRWGFNWFIQR